MKHFITLLCFGLIGCTHSDLGSADGSEHDHCLVRLASEYASEQGINMELYDEGVLTKKTFGEEVFFTGKKHVPGRHLIVRIKNGKPCELLPGA